MGRAAKRSSTRPHGTYRWHPSPDYAPPEERALARRIGNKFGGWWKIGAEAEGTLA